MLKTINTLFTLTLVCSPLAWTEYRWSEVEAATRSAIRKGSVKAAKALLEGRLGDAGSTREAEFHSLFGHVLFYLGEIDSGITQLGVAIKMFASEGRGRMVLVEKGNLAKGLIMYGRCDAAKEVLDQIEGGRKHYVNRDDLLDASWFGMKALMAIKCRDGDLKVRLDEAVNFAKERELSRGYFFHELYFEREIVYGRKVGEAVISVKNMLVEGAIFEPTYHRVILVSMANRAAVAGDCALASNLLSESDAMANVDLPLWIDDEHVHARKCLRKP